MEICKVVAGWSSRCLIRFTGTIRERESACERASFTNNVVSCSASKCVRSVNEEIRNKNETR